MCDTAKGGSIAGKIIRQKTLALLVGRGSEAFPGLSPPKSVCSRISCLVRAPWKPELPLPLAALFCVVTLLNK